MRSLTRRRAVRLAGAGLVGVSAGCGALRREPSEAPELHRLRASNSDTRPHAVHVILVEDGDPVYWNSRELKSSEGDEVDSVTFEGFPTEAAPYVLHARVEGRPRSEWRTVEFAEFDQPCLSLDLEIGGGGSDPAGQLSVRYGIGGDGCLSNHGTETGTASGFPPGR